ncbi:MAG: hypothetical protein DA408_06705 [Bacteroidetes bacterium]|nr:MAG: hypothetical protein C7N36_04460 [Bacteroidota bacterium]PTM13529.1 MAG: hypothetical protein DA408_06705 [Bacteroidota bacterium]
MRKRKINIPTFVAPFLVVVVTSLIVRAQPTTDTIVYPADKPTYWSVGGYLKDLQSIQFTQVKEKWTLDNLVHHRIDLYAYPSSAWKVHLGVRNRLIYGESTSLYLMDESLLEPNRAYFDLSKIIVKGTSFLFHTTIDRAALDYTYQKWQLTVGRQRINWGLNLVWNPNDIFNAYSYFDFDYEERPGTDAVRVQYYINATTTAELAFQPGKTSNDAIAAGLYRFTKASYDIQLLAGRMKTDYVLGGGWSGILGDAGFNGEITGFVPRQNTRWSGVVITVSVGGNYTFANSLYLHGSYLLNSAGLSRDSSLPPDFLLTSVSAKSLSPARHSLFAEVAYPITPLIRSDLAGIVNPVDGSFFISPFTAFSLTNTIELLAGGQLFFGNPNALYGNLGKAIFIRLKWSY